MSLPSAIHQYGQRYLADIGCAVLVVVLYFASARVGLALMVPSANLAVIWPPSGILFAVLLLRPWRHWPIMLLAAGGAIVLSNVMAGIALVVSLGFAFANLAESMLAAALVTRWSSAPYTLRRLRTVVALVGGAAGIGNALTSLFGAAVPKLAYNSAFWESWRIWWSAHGLGMVLVGGALLAWAAPDAAQRRANWATELAVFIACLATLAAALFVLPPSAPLALSPYLLFPPLLWAAICFGPRVVTTALLALGLGLIVATLHGRGAFALPGTTPAEHVLEVQAFLLVLSATALVLAAATAERQAAQVALAQGHALLEQRVSERTAALRFQSVLLDTVQQAVIATDLDGRVSYWNRFAEMLYGWHADEALGRPLLVLVPSSITCAQARDIFDQLCSGSSWSGELVVRRRDGSSFLALVTESPVLDSTGQMIGLVGISVDITDRKLDEEQLRQLNIALELQLAERTTMLSTTLAQLQAELGERRRAEAALSDSELRFRTLTTLAPVGIFATDDAGLLTFANACWGVITGRAVAQSHGVHWSAAVHPEDRERVVLAWQASAQQKRGYHTEVRYQHPDGTVVWTLGDLVALRDSSGDIAGYLGTLTDMTAQKQAEQHLNASLREKEVLLKEVHHRVKNNLQVVTSLLRLQERTVDDIRARQALQECQQRVEVMVLVHELLYHSSDLTHIHVASYLTRLSNQVQRLYSSGQHQLTITTDINRLPLEAAVTCGLIVHELLSNSYKYAFPDGRVGSVGVALHQLNATQLQLRVWDTGIGMPAAPAPSRSLGMRLIQGLVHQLRGNMTRADPPGTTVIITFPLPPAAMVLAIPAAL